MIDWFMNLSADGWTAIFTAGLLATAIATVIYAHFQWRAARNHQKELRKAEAEALRPYIVVTVESSPAAFNLFDLVIRNIGKRPAVNITIDLDPPPQRARESGETDTHIQNMKLLNEPMALIAPGQEIRVFYDNHIERVDHEDLPEIHDAKVAYTDTSGAKYRGEFTLDILALKGASQVNIGTVHDVSKELNKIAQRLSKAGALERSPELTVHAVTESRTDYRTRYLEKEYLAEKKHYDLRRHVARRRSESEPNDGRLRDIRHEQEANALESLTSLGTRAHHGLRRILRIPKVKLLQLASRVVRKKSR